MNIIFSFMGSIFSLTTNFFSEVFFPTGMWEWFLGKAFAGITNYGLRIFVFTLILKIILFPLDVFQKKTMRDNARKMERMKPQLQELQEAYGHDKGLLSKKQMELYKKEKYSMFSSCLPMIVTLAVFLTLFSGFTNITSYMSLKTYATLHTTYTQYYENADVEGYTPYDIDTLQPYMTAYKQKESVEADFYVRFRDPDYDTMSESEKQAEDQRLKGLYDQCFIVVADDVKPIVKVVDDDTTPPADNRTDYEKFRDDAVDFARVALAQDKVVYVYENDKEGGKQSFLWVKSIWVEDVPWKNPIQSKADFIKLVERKALFFPAGPKLVEQNADIIGDYDKVMGGLAANYTKKPNGFLVLVLLAAGLSFLTQFVTSKQQKNTQPAIEGAGAGASAGMMKVMMYAMPVMMGVFALTYSSAFAIYMISNSLITLGLMFVTTFVLKILDQMKEKRELNAVHILRTPDEIAEKKSKKKSGGFASYDRQNLAEVIKNKKNDQQKEEKNKQDDKDDNKH